MKNKVKRNQQGEGRGAVRTAAGFALTALLPILLISCTTFREDRCYLEDPDYEFARALFLRTGSVDITHRYLESNEWMRCQINEAIYRLSKEFEVVSN